MIKVVGYSVQNVNNKEKKYLRKIISYYEQIPVLNPENPYIIAWNAVILFTILFYLFQMGFLIGFGQVFWRDQLNNFYFGNLLFLVLLIIDLFISPLKAYYENGILFKNRIVILKHYIRGGGLIIDLLGLFGLIVPIISQQITLNILKVLFFGKLYTAYYIDDALLLQIRNKFSYSHYFGLARVIILAVLWTHYLAIGFFLVDFTLYKSNYFGPNTPNFCWIYNSAIDVRIDHAEWLVQYVYSMYYSIGNITTIAYGDIVPLNYIEAIYVFICMIISVVLFTYFLKEILEIIFYAQADKFANTNHIITISNFLHNHHINNRLRIKILSFFQLSWRQQKYRNSQQCMNMIKVLPKNIREELNLSIYGTFLRQLGLISKQKPFLHFSNRTSFIYSLLQQIDIERRIAGDLIYTQGQQFIEHPYIFYCQSENRMAITLGQGIIPTLYQHSSNQQLSIKILDLIFQKSIKIAYKSGLFGELQFFNENNRSHWAICNQNIQLFRISKSDFIRIVQKEGTQHEKQVIFAEWSQTSRRCYVCMEAGHNFKFCSWVNYRPKNIWLHASRYSINKRINHVGIKNVRHRVQMRTIKNNSLKVYKKIQHTLINLRTSLMEIGNLERQQVQQQTDIETLLNSFLYQAYFIKKDDTKRNKSTFQLSEESHQIDKSKEYKFYKPWNNLSSILVSYNMRKDI